MTTWHFYDLATGLFTRQRLAASDQDLVAANTPPGCGAYAGEVDPDSQRVDVATGDLVDWQPPRPSEDHAWDTERRRWELSPAAAKREAERIDAQRRITALEIAQLRPLRELLLDQSSQPARARLAEIDAEIATLRPAVAARGSLTR